MDDVLKRQKGFTLVELLIAITIFAIGLLAIAGMQVTALQTNSSANSLTVATSLAEGVLEEFMAMSSTDDLLTTNATNQDWWPADRTIAGGGTYNAKYTVEVGVPSGSVSKITVVVAGGGRTVTLSGYKSLL